MELIKISKSNTSIAAQLVSDGKTLVGRSYKFQKGQKPADQSFKYGEEFGKLAKAKSTSKVSFDRGRNRYHGNVKLFAEGLRKAGLEF